MDSGWSMVVFGGLKEGLGSRLVDSGWSMVAFGGLKGGLGSRLVDSGWSMVVFGGLKGFETSGQWTVVALLLYECFRSQNCAVLAAES